MEEPLKLLEISVATGICALLSIGAAAIAPQSRANSQNPPINVINTTVTYIPHSSQKVQQIVGDYDYALWKNGKGIKKPTASLTESRFDVDGTDTFYSFEDAGRLIFLFGDTIGQNENYGAHDAMAWSTATDPEAGLLINCFTYPDGKTLLVEPPGVAMGGFDIPNSGIELNGQTYIVCSTGANAKNKLVGKNPQQNEFSVLTQFDMKSLQFKTGRTISRAPYGHFVIVALHRAVDSSPKVYMFGTGLFRQSDIYLCRIPSDSFWSGMTPANGQSAAEYFTGLRDGQPAWSNREGDSAPVVVDNPQDITPAPIPTAGNLSVVYSKELGLWLMTYDGGRQTKRTNGIYFSYAQQPWGPWSTPQLIFNRVRDHAFGVYIHNPNADPPDNIAGPMIGPKNPQATPGGDYAPQMIERFTTVQGNTLKIYYSLSTWNPYTVVEMRSEFQISHSVGWPSGWPR